MTFDIYIYIALVVVFSALMGIALLMLRRAKERDIRAFKQTVVEMKNNIEKRKEVIATMPVKEKEMDINLRSEADKVTMVISIESKEDLGRLETLLNVTKAGVDIEILKSAFVAAHVAKYLTNDAWAVKEPANDGDKWSVLTTKEFVYSLENKTNQF